MGKGYLSLPQMKIQKWGSVKIAYELKWKKEKAGQRNQSKG